MTMLENLHGILERGVDSALLRYSIGTELIKTGDSEAAVMHLREAVKLDKDYSAAWKELGKALSETGKHEEAIDVFQAGIAVAERRGDIQAAKEMGVFHRRAAKAVSAGQPAH